MLDSEFRAYSYIERVLDQMGWNTRNPARGGAVYTQGEFRSHNPALSEALGRQTPENIIVIPWEGGLRYWIVEAKRQHQEREVALSEAQAYADTINQREPGAARFATGIAGSPDLSFYVTTTYWDGNEWREVVINNYATTGFLSQQQCREILDRNDPAILRYEVDSDDFLAKANDINSILHNNGIAARDRARLVAGLLLALAQDSTMQIGNDPRTLVRDVNTRIERLLEQHNKDDFRHEIELKLPATTENHRKYWSAIVQTMQRLREINIRSAINSGTDALGQFYETFLKYANDASEMGIVLTPRHITKFAADIVGIHHNDTVFDPTCGTGGFLVAALDAVRAAHYENHLDIYDLFRNDCLFGIELADDVFSLALVNMIFRGDGKSNIHNGNCFDNRFVRTAGNVQRLHKDIANRSDSQRPFTRTLMNPPFALEEEKEIEFVNYALESMAPGGRLFAILPNEPITGTRSDERSWREQILSRHTVRAVVRMQDDLFQPNTSKGTYALVLETWRQHQSTDRTYFGVLHDDDHAGYKSKTLSLAARKDNMDRITEEIQSFLANPNVEIAPVVKESAIARIKMDGGCDFASEAYLSGDPQINQTQAVQGLHMALTRRSLRRAPVQPETPNETREYTVGELLTVERGQARPLKYLPEGDTPVVTTSEQWNGITGYYDVPTEAIRQNAITISTNGSSGNAFWHPYAFAATSDVLVCTLAAGGENPPPSLYLYICNAINANAWRYDYYRKCSVHRLQADVRIPMPMIGEEIDIDFIDAAMERMPGYRGLMEMLDVSE